MGRAAVALFPDGTALVGWVNVNVDANASKGSGPALLARRVTPDGKLGPILSVGQSNAIRGRIKLASSGETMLMTWVEDGDTAKVHVASIVER